MNEDETCTAFCFCESTEEKGILQYLIVACAKGLSYRPTTQADRTNIKVYLYEKNKF